MPMPKISLRTNILIIFLLLISLLGATLIITQYTFSKQLAIEATHTSFKRIKQNVLTSLQVQTNITDQTLISITKDERLLAPITFEYKHPILNNFIQTLRLKKDLLTLYFTQGDNKMYSVVDIKSDPTLIKELKAPKETRWVVFIIINQLKKWIFLDKYMQKLSEKEQSVSYDIKTRTWYKQAMLTDSIIRTQAYKFDSTKEKGFTYALKVPSSNIIVGLDYVLTTLNELLARQKSQKDSEIYVLNTDGIKYASSNMLKIRQDYQLDPRIKNALKENNFSEIINSQDHGVNYFTLLNKVPKHKAIIGIKVNADILFYPYYQSTKNMLLISLALVICMIPIILYTSTLLTRPLKALKAENDKIRNRDFSKIVAIDTMIIEYSELSSSLVNMSESIQAYEKSQEAMLDSIIKLIAEAIDSKSPYTGGHCRRVPMIAQELLQAADNSNEQAFKEFVFNSKDELREFEIGAWLHDCGKVTTPEYVVDKSTKLETIYNRIHEIRMRFEVLLRDSEIAHLKGEITQEKKEQQIQKLQDDFAFIATANVGGEYMSDDKKARIKEIAKQEWLRYFDNSLGLGELEKLRYAQTKSTSLPVIEKLLCDKSFHIIKREFFDLEAYEADGFKEEVPEYLYNYGEVYNLCIEKGTLTPEERFKINEHVIMSIKMLEKIPFPKHLKNIPEYAGTHHETLIGTGHPRKLTKDELSIPSRIMAIADIFEALTASDRPYKKAKTLSESLKIMSYMVKDQHIDADLFELFLRSGIYERYAKNFLDKEQVDSVNIEDYLS